jgi:type IV secretion system protein VirD4
LTDYSGFEGRATALSVHGTARFATEDELGEQALILNGPGLSAACRGVHLGQWFNSKYNFQPVRYAGDLHQLIVAGTGGGKFTTAIAPMLLASSDLLGASIVVVDPKGEIAKLAGPYFEFAFARDRRVALLDPWDIVGTGETSALNVLATITADNPNHVDDARALADAMIIPSGADNKHWDTAARGFLTAVLLYVALHENEKDRRDLLRVREIVTLSWVLPKRWSGEPIETLSDVVFGNLDSPLANGAVATSFRGMKNREDKERSGILSSIERDTAWMDSPQMAKVLRGPTVDLGAVNPRGLKCFICLPPEFFMTHRGWLRLMVVAFATAFKRHRPDPSLPKAQRWRHIIIDEFANLGEMSFVQNDLAVARGYDVKYHLAIQDLAQLKGLYGDAWESFLGNTFQRFFAIGDIFTAEYVSRLLGASTVQSVSTSSGSSYTNSRGVSLNDSYSSTRGFGQDSSFSSGRGSGSSLSISEGRSWGQSTSQVGRPLMTPDEVLRLPNDEQLLFIRPMHPIRCRRPPYWDTLTGLPIPFDLKTLWGTIGRQPKDEDEFQKFYQCHSAIRLVRPEQRPKQAVAATAPAPAAPQSHRVAYIVAASLVALSIVAAGWWFWPRSEPIVPPEKPPAKQAEVSPPTTKDTTPPATAPSSLSLLEPESIVTSIGRRPAPTRPRISGRSIPDWGSVGALPTRQAQRDYIIAWLRSFMDGCTPRYSSAEYTALEKFLFYLKRPTEWVGKNDPRFAEASRYADLVARYQAKPNWSRTDREDVLEIVFRASHEGLVTGGLAQAINVAFARFYADGCPFNSVTDAAYVPPRIGSTNEGITQPAPEEVFPKSEAARRVDALLKVAISR